MESLLRIEGRILLQNRRDEDNWCIPGSIIELGEPFEETAKRETFEGIGGFWMGGENGWCFFALE